jgi:hypothetical protein
VVETFERDDVENGVLFVSGISSIDNSFVAIIVFLFVQSENESTLLEKRNFYSNKN